MTALTIRDEQPADVAAIRTIIKRAFASVTYSTHTEHLIVDALRQAGVLSVSLVAEQPGEVVGHVAFSPVIISDGSPGWYGLGPVAVDPAHQGNGIGAALIEHGLVRLRELGARGCVVLGETGYYARFGFRHDEHLVLPGVPAEYFLAMAFTSQKSGGEVTYHDSFNVTA